MTLIAITRLRVRCRRFLPAFLYQTLRVAIQARRAQGNLAVSVLRDAQRTFWTRTAWTDEAAMGRYLAADPHRRIMRSLAGWCDEASVVHWIQPTAQPPLWPEAHRRMQGEGRPSRVDHPTEAHREFRIPAIRTRSR